VISRSEAEDLLRDLDAERPRLLAWLVGEVPLGGSTLETGCGASTIVLGALARRHVAVSPVAAEHDRVRKWCADRGLDLAVELVEARSDEFLPAAGLEAESLDVVLVDGDPSFPAPALDWHHTAPALKVGGLVVVAAAERRAGAVLAGVLAADGGWRRRHRVDGAAVFEKVAPSGDGAWDRDAPSLETRLRRRSRQVAALRRLRADPSRPCAGGEGR
jgi:predicted O-methyltransferase YrrM